MKKTAILLILVILLVSMLMGCATTYTTGNGKLSYGDIRGSEKGEFEATESYMYIFHPELMTFGTKHWENLENMIDPAVAEKGGNAAKELTITDGFTTVDFILTYLTGGLLGFGHITVSGTAIAQ